MLKDIEIEVVGVIMSRVLPKLPMGGSSIVTTLTHRKRIRFGKGGGGSSGWG